MYNLDSLSLKLFIEENKEYLTNATVQKIQMPSRKEVIFHIRNLGQNKKLFVNIDPKFPHIYFVKSGDNENKLEIKIPKEPPMFCMQLRKHLECAKIKGVQTVEYERMVEFYFEVYDEIGSLSKLCLAIELMGKHSNIILYNTRNGVIIGCAHNISPEKSSIREVYGGISYIYPPKQDKTDILKTSFGGFAEVLKNAKNMGIPIRKAISQHYYYLSEALVEKIDETSKEGLFQELQNIVAGNNIEFIKDFWGGGESINEAIRGYFSTQQFDDVFGAKIRHLKKIINKELKKHKETVKNAPSEEKYLAYKQKGELIFQYIYKIKPMDEKLVEDGLTVELDPNKSATENAKKYFSLYNKGKTGAIFQKKRIEEAKENIEYLESILFSMENSGKMSELSEIQEELNELLKVAIKAGKKDKKTPLTVENIEFEGFEIYIGKNNKQNEHLLKKLSSPEDLWFHTNNCPSGHIYVKTENGRKSVPDSVLLRAAELTKENSPLKNTSKAEIIYTKRKYLKRPPETKLGYVTYSNEKEIVV